MLYLLIYVPQVKFCEGLRDLKNTIFLKFLFILPKNNLFSTIVMKSKKKGANS